MDPLTGLGVACNVLQMVDFGLKTIKKGKEISQYGQTKNQRHLQDLANQTLELCAKLKAQQSRTDTATVALKDFEQRPVALTFEEEVHKDARPAKRLALARSAGSEAADVAVAAVNDAKDVDDLLQKVEDVAQDLDHMMSDLKIADSSTIGRAGLLKRKYTSAKKLVKGIWSADEVQMLQAQMRDLQQMLIMRLSILQHQATANLVQQLGHVSIRLESERVKELAHFDKLTTNLLNNLSIEADNADVLQDLLNEGLQNLSMQARYTNIHIHILNTLYFPEIDWRNDNIKQTHESTGNWLYAERGLGFMEWLRDKDGTFWITGKPGSGKSTLMKHTVAHAETTRLLWQWAGTRRLVIAEHYFWNVGSAIHRTREGLARTLLYHIIRDCPEVATTIVPDRLQQPSELNTISWTLLELTQALKTCGSALARVNACICYFIDGLDECEDDHLELVEFISSLAKQAGVKICIASRPWNIFRNAYDNKTDGQLSMQEYNAGDIQAYIADNMFKHSHFRLLSKIHAKRCDQLIKDIGQKAQGVFLWVALVVNSLLRGLGNDDSIDVLYRRLDHYPQTLDGYFDRMFDRIEDIYQQHACRILLCALAAEHPLLAIDPIFLEMEVRDPQYAEKLSVTSHQHAMVATPRYVDARCADLLEIIGNNICFIHRTAKDFLSRGEMSSRLVTLAGKDFILSLSQARLILSRMKSVPMTRLSISQAINALSDLVIAADTTNLEHMRIFRNLLQNLDKHGDSFFAGITDYDMPDEPFVFAPDTEKASPMVPKHHPNEGYSGSYDALKVCNLLSRCQTTDVRSSKSIDAVPVGDEESDAYSLFGDSTTRSCATGAQPPCMT